MGMAAGLLGERFIRQGDVNISVTEAMVVVISNSKNNGIGS